MLLEGEEKEKEGGKEKGDIVLELIKIGAIVRATRCILLSIERLIKSLGLIYILLGDKGV